MTSSEGSIRGFIALEIPSAVKLTLQEAIQSLNAQIPKGVRWLDPSAMHLTLKFLGSVAPGMISGILDAVGRSAEPVAPFRISLSGLGMFPNEKRPRVLWAGVQGDLDAILELQQRVEEAMHGLGFAPEERRFSPHLTLGRVRDQVSGSLRRQIGSAVSSASLGTAEPWLVREVHLVQSVLAPGGASYTTLGSIALGLN